MNEIPDTGTSQETITPEKAEKKKKKIGCGGCLGLTVFTVIVLVVGMFAGGTITLLSGLTSRLMPHVSAEGGKKQESIDNDKILEKLQVMETLVDNYFLYDVDAEKVEDNIYQGFTRGLNDDYAEYYNEQEYHQLMEEDSGEYQGIGVTVYKDPSNGFTHISEVFKDNPAYRAGLQNEDLITSVNGEGTAELTVTEVVRKIKDPANKKVTLGILRGDETFEVEVEKEQISLESVTWEMKTDDIGYIAVSQFIETTPDKFREAIDALEKKGMKKLIIDLRDNGGGLVDSCTSMLSRIIEKDKVLVYTENRAGARDQYKSTTEETLNIPMVVLINGNSASSSEIMTGCLKDYKTATIVGQTSYGKGIIQNIIPLGDGTAVKFTILEYLTPNGNKIHKKGIEPDVEVKIEDEDWIKVRDGKKEDTQLKKALEILKSK